MIVPSQKANDTNGDVDAVIAEGTLRSSVIAEVHQWRSQGQPLDARALLDERPELGASKSIVIELAYEEFCQRAEAGEPVDPESFCKRFPTIEKSLRRQIEVQQFLDENPEVFSKVDVDWPDAGQDFRGFSILAEIGRGTFGRVFLAEEIALGRRLVAIKVSVDGTLEAEILGRLQHPNIVPVYSVQPDDLTGLTVVCMPYLGRVTLYDVLDRLFGEKKKPSRSRSIVDAIRDDGNHPMPTGDAAGSIDGELYHGSYVDGALHLGAQLAEALAYSHSRGICHCDLKPSNVMVTPGGRPMLLDFNLAFDSEAMDRRLGGTLPYMAPEQLRSMDNVSTRASDSLSERSDIFSLGVILYELLSGRLPFGPIATNRPCDEIRTSLLERQKRGPLRLRDANEEVDPKLAAIVESCLAFNPNRRPQCASELAAALRASRSTVRRVERWTRRHSLIAFGGVACLVFAGVATGYHFATRDPDEIRMFNSGGKAYLAGNYDEADKYFNRVVESSGPKDRVADAYFWQGQACLKLGRDSDAVTCFREVNKLRLDGKTTACHAYACARKGLRTDCINLSKYAINAGFATAEVYNNLGYAYWREGEFDKSIEVLDRAIKLKPGLQPAYYNRAWTEFLWHRAQGRPLDVRAAQDIDVVIRGRSGNAYAFYDAALIYSRLGEDPDQYRERIAEYLCRALRLGVDPDLVRENFPSLMDDPNVEQALVLAVSVVRRNLLDQLADPFPDQPFPFR